MTVPNMTGKNHTQILDTNKKISSAFARSVGSIVKKRKYLNSRGPV